MSHDVFISYSSHDKAIADAACARLEGQGVRCWIAPRDVLPGRPYAESLITAISRSKLFVLIFSNGSNRSQQVLREVERAVSKGIPILPFRVEDVVPTASMEYFLAVPHWLDALTPPLEKHLDTLASSVKHLLDLSMSPQSTSTEAPQSDAPQTVTDAPVTRVCPFCGKFLKVEAFCAGREVPCPGCTALLHVPPDRSTLIVVQPPVKVAARNLGPAKTSAKLDQVIEQRNTVEERSDTAVTNEPANAASRVTTTPSRPALAPRTVGRRLLLPLTAVILLGAVPTAVVLGLRNQPTSIDPLASLKELSALVEQQDYPRARKASDQLIAEKSPAIGTDEFKKLVEAIEKGETKVINQSFSQRLDEIRTAANNLRAEPGQAVASFKRLHAEVEELVNDADLRRVDPTMIDQARVFQRELVDSRARSESQFEFQMAIKNLDPTGGLGELAAALSDVRNRYPEQSKNQPIDVLVSESQADLWNGVVAWSDYFKRKEHIDAALLEPAVAGQMISEGDALAQKYEIRMCVDEYSRRRPHLDAVRRRVADLAGTKLSHVLVDRWTKKNQLMRGLYLVEVDDGRKYYSANNPLRPGGKDGGSFTVVVPTSNREITVNYITSYNGDTESIGLPANKIRVRRAPHCDLVVSLTETISNARNITTIDWVPTFCKLVEMIQQTEDVDPIITAMLLKETLQDGSTGSRAIAAAFAKHKSEMDLVSIDRLVKWFLPDDHQANVQRSAAKESLDNLPKGSAAGNNAVQIEKSLYQAPNCRFTYAGWLKSSGTTWEVADAQIRSMTGELYVLAKTDNDGAVDVFEVATAEGGQINWKPTQRNHLLNWRPVFLAMRKP